VDDHPIPRKSGAQRGTGKTGRSVAWFQAWVARRTFYVELVKNLF
jgi:hypothetical protein